MDSEWIPPCDTPRLLFNSKRGVSQGAGAAVQPSRLAVVQVALVAAVATMLAAIASATAAASMA